MRITLTTLAVTAIAVAAALPSTAAPAQTVRVTETDYRIVLSARPKAGRVTFVVRNTGDHAHDFRLRGGGVAKKTRLLGPGQTAGLTVRLRRGVRYQLWCAPHADKGMRARFVAR